jgi:exopolyphosphatase / guanosine-5'-triphosphate,3'-diphosphate pyrophosphatase
MVPAIAPIPDILAAVDLGSNSFHMVVARHSHGQLTIVDRLRESVRLASGLDERGRLSRESTERALATLARFGQRLQDMRATSVRVVGTNTLRKAHRKAGFMERAAELLGHPIEIISGIEEARLIYAGVTQTMPLDPTRRLVIDIGGGSTECIIGEGFNPIMLESLYMGCVAISDKFFPHGRVSAKKYARALVECEVELEPIEVPFREIGWQHCVGASGSVKAIYDVIKELQPNAVGITAKGLDTIAARLIAAGSIAKAGFASLAEERWPVFGGGLAILKALFNALRIDEMRLSEGALREGLLYDLLGRYSNEDARERTVQSMMSRFHVDVQQAKRVETTVLELLKPVRAAWGLQVDLAETVLAWSARLHEIGLDISHSSHHKHAAYLLEHADMPGFPREEQMLLACVVGSHRRKLSLSRVDELLPPWHVKSLYLMVLLRLSVLLNRGRTREALPKIRLTPASSGLALRFPRGWLKAHALTQADLELEVHFLKAVGFRLVIA